MKVCIAVLAIGLISCSQSKRESKAVDSDLKSKISCVSKKKKKSSGFNNQGESFVVVSKKGGMLETEINNVNYSEEYLNYQNELKNYIVKTSQLTKSLRGVEGSSSSIDVEIYNIPDSKIISKFNVDADAVTLESDFYKTEKYACCGGENYYELVSLWKNETFLKYNNSYYYIEIPSARIHFYIGFNIDARDKENLILGELYFAHSLPQRVAGKNIISHNFKTVNKVIFKVKNKELFDKIDRFSPNMRLLKNTEEDKLVDYTGYHEMRLWSYNNCSSLENVSFNAFKIDFSGDVDIPVTIPIENGYLYGEPNNMNKVVYINK